MIATLEKEQDIKEYNPLHTCKQFHESPAQIRSIVGPVGSGKTSAAAWDICYYLPYFLYEKYGIKKTRWCVVRNTYDELIDTTQKTLFEWFPFGNYAVKRKIYVLNYPDDGIKSEIMFRSCDRPQDMKKFKSLEITGYWIDESIEVPDEIKRMLKNRIGRYPKKCPVRFGIETTNPPDVELPMYSQYHWNIPPPGPIPTGTPLENHAGFWQPPGENDANLRAGYYADLRRDYADNPDWIEMYIEGKPGIIIRGKLVYNNFKREYHEAKSPLVWTSGPLYVGWDNSGNCPACAVVQVPSPMRTQVLAEYHSDKMGIVDFGNYVNNMMSMRFPNASEITHWGDPAGEAKYSKTGGGLTSNAELMRDECGIDVMSSEQNPVARISSVDKMLGRIDGLLIDPSCTRLLNGFIGGYCYPENKSVMGEYMSNVLKNKFSHVHDALQYVMVKLFGSQEATKVISQRLIKKDMERNRRYDPLRRKIHASRS